MLEFDTTEVRSTCDKHCKYHIHWYSEEREFLHSNNCIRRWTNEGQKGNRATESVSPSSKSIIAVRQPLGFVTLDLFSGVCRKCKDTVAAGYKYCWECESSLRHP